MTYDVRKAFLADQVYKTDKLNEGTVLPDTDPLLLGIDVDGVVAVLTHAYDGRVYFDIENDGAAEWSGCCGR
jgi:hypothetical protein